MSNEYFSKTTVARLSLIRSTAFNTHTAAVEAGFDKLPARTTMFEGRVNFYTDAGSANAYTVTMTPTLTSYVEGLKIAVKITNTNTGSSTLNIDSLGARSIKRQDGTNVEATDLTAGDVHEFRYDGSSFVMVTQSRVHLALSAATAGGPLTLTNQGKFKSSGSSAGYVEMFAALSSGGGRIDFSSGSNVATTFDIDADEVSTADADIRMFRNTSTTGNAEFTMYQGNGTATKVHSFFAASAALCRTSGNLAIGLATGDRKVHVYDTDAEVALIESTQTSAYLNLEASGTTSNTHVGIAAMGDDILFRAGDATRARVDENGAMVSGSADSLLAGYNIRPSFQALGTDGTTSIMAGRFSADTTGPRLILVKGRGSVAAGSTRAESGDVLGEIVFAGADGTDLNSKGAYIRCVADGATGTADMPGRLEFATTANSAEDPTLQMTIDRDGGIIMHNLPTSDPTEAGQLWNNSGALAVSAG